MYLPIVIKSVNVNSYDIKVGVKDTKYYRVTPTQMAYISQRFHYIQYEPEYRSKLSGQIIFDKELQVLEKIKTFIEFGCKL